MSARGQIVCVGASWDCLWTFKVPFQSPTDCAKDNIVDQRSNNVCGPNLAADMIFFFSIEAFVICIIPSKTVS